MKSDRRLRLAVAAPLVLAVSLLGACSSEDKADTAIAVAADATTCGLGTTSVAGGTIGFDVTNDDDAVTEVYVYAADGKKVMGELENIGPGLTRSFTVKLKPGTYQVACKPGMKGSGIRTELTVTE